MDVGVLGFGVGVLELWTREVVLLGGDIGEYFEEVGRGGNKDGGGESERDDGQRVNDKWGEEGGRANGGIGEEWDSEAAGGVTIRAWIVPGVVRAIEEVLNDLVGGADVYLVDVVNLQPRGDREGRGGDGGGSGGSGKRRRHLNTFN